MSTKKTKSSSKNGRVLQPKLLITLGFLLLGVFLLGIFYFQPKILSLKAQVSPTVSPQRAQIASVQATTKPTSTPTPKPSSPSIPAYSGKSVRVPILMYHYIGNNPNPADTARYVLSTAPDVFQQQMDYLSSQGFNPISLDTLYAALHGGSLPPKPIVLSFDDGYIDFYINAFPILKAHNFHATSFIPTGLINTSYYMTWSQISEIQSSGLVSFEAHSVHHSDLPTLSAARQQYEIDQSKKDLEAHIGAPVNFFAYPYGTSNQAIWSLVKQDGFFGAVGTWSGNVESEGTQYDWPRIRISGGVSLTQYAKLVN